MWWNLHAVGTYEYIFGFLFFCHFLLRTSLKLAYVVKLVVTVMAYNLLGTAGVRSICS